VEELPMHLGWRWFTGLSFDQEIPHRSRFSKNRHGRFEESKLFEQVFEHCAAVCRSGIGTALSLIDPDDECNGDVTAVDAFSND
jgi:hypothetical protein